MPAKESWTKVDNKLKARRDLTGTAKLIYATIVDAMRGTGTATIGQRRIGELVGASNQVVTDAIKVLEEAELLSVERGRSGQRTTYELPTKAPRKQGRLSARETRALSPKPPKVKRPGNKGASARETRTRKEQTKRVSLSTDLPGTKVPKPTEKRTRKKDPIWDAACEVFALEPVTRPQQTRVGKVVAELKQLKATPEEIRQHAERYRRDWGPDIECTPEAVLKHWDRFKVQIERSAVRADHVENQRDMEASKAKMELEGRRRTIAIKILSDTDSAAVEAEYAAYIAEQPPGTRKFFNLGRLAADRWAVSLVERLAPGRIDEMMAKRGAPNV